MHWIFPILCMATAAQAQEATVVTIFGQGQTRQLQSVSNDDLIKLVPGSSPLKALEKLPGVAFQSADPFGAYEWSTRLSIRGFNQNQLGFTLDGVPLGDMSYTNNNGLHISRAITAENLARAAVSQGAGSLSTASTSNLGGTVQFVGRDPAEAAGIVYEQTVGSNKTLRSFARLESGRIAGAKAYLSVLRHRADKTKGQGGQDLDQVNARAQYDNGSLRLSAFVNTTDRKETDYQDMSIDMLQRLGYEWDNYVPDWQRAVDAARGQFSGGVTNKDDAYFNARGLRKDLLAAVSGRWSPQDNLTLKTTLYHHDDLGQGHWYTPYLPPGYTLPLAIRTTEYAVHRSGVLLDASWDVGAHELSAGMWVENNLHRLARRFYTIDGPQETNYFLSNPYYTAFQQNFSTHTTQFYLADTLTLDQLKLNAGFKAPDARTVSTNLVASRAAGSLEASSHFLPQLGANYKLNGRDEVFATWARNLRAFQPGVLGPFSATQAAFNASISSLKPERSTSLDLGYRWRNAAWQGTLSAYRTEFDDRLLSVSNCAGVVGCPNTFINVGKVLTKGLEAAASVKPARGWTVFGSLSWNDSRYQADYLDNIVIHAAGKTVVDAPRLLSSFEVSWEGESWSVRGGAKYTSKRYYTYLNDAEVPGYWLTQLSFQYPLAKGVVLQANASNLLNARYISTIGSNGFINSDPAGSFATLLTGAPRQIFVAITFSR